MNRVPIIPPVGRSLALIGLIVAGGCLSLLESGCTLAPFYKRPAAPVDQNWPTGSAYSSTAAAANSPTGMAADIGWREFFRDPRLQRLIELAIAHNPDARIAALNVAAAQAQYRIQRADLFPSIAASGSETAEKFPAAIAGIASVAGGGLSSGAIDSGGSTFRLFQAGIGFTSYEVDVFGRIRSLTKERLEQYLGYVETRRSTQISLVAQVASTYLTLLADQQLLAITQSTLDSQRNSYELTKMSYEGGVATELDLRQAETSVDTARANIEQYTRQVAQDQNALTVLIGVPMPSDLPTTNGFDEQKLLEELPAGLPSDLLIRRPDVAAAEHNLIAANANVGAARAAFFPSVTLTGNYGTASTKLSGLFEHGSTSWSFSPQISLPIFAGGANMAALDLAKIEKNVDIAQYEQAIQNAFREVSDGLAGRGTLDRQIDATQALVAATDASYKLSDMRFREGIDDYLNVLDSQRALYSAQQGLITVKLARMQNLVTLYKALGGGWNESSEPQSAKQASLHSVGVSAAR